MTGPVWKLYDECLGNNFHFNMTGSEVISLLLTFEQSDLYGIRIEICHPPSDTEQEDKKTRRQEDKYRHVFLDFTTEQKKGHPQTREEALKGETPSDDVLDCTTVGRIKQFFPIARFVAPYTNGLKPSGPSGHQGKWFIGRCPFHQSKTNKRNLWVNTDKGICGCFVPRCPASKKPLDVINFYAMLKGISNGEAIQQLADSLSQ